MKNRFIHIIHRVIPSFHKIHVYKLVFENCLLSKHLELIHIIHLIVDKAVCKSCRISSVIENSLISIQKRDHLRSLFCKKV